MTGGRGCTVRETNIGRGRVVVVTGAAPGLVPLLTLARATKRAACAEHATVTHHRRATRPTWSRQPAGRALTAFLTPSWRSLGSQPRQDAADEGLEHGNLLLRHPV